MLLKFHFIYRDFNNQQRHQVVVEKSVCGIKRCLVTIIVKDLLLLQGNSSVIMLCDDSFWSLTLWHYVWILNNKKFKSISNTKRQNSEQNDQLQRPVTFMAFDHLRNSSFSLIVGVYV